jgi:hypothetical protein
VTIDGGGPERASVPCAASDHPDGRDPGASLDDQQFRLNPRGRQRRRVASNRHWQAVVADGLASAADAHDSTENAAAHHPRQINDPHPLPPAANRPEESALTVREMPICARSAMLDGGVRCECSGRQATSAGQVPESDDEVDGTVSPTLRR